MKTQELIEWIRQWNMYCEHITVATIFAKMRFDRGTNHVINYGPPGSGKSRSTLELINALALGTEVILDNTTTAKGLFETILNYPEQDIVLDECSTLLKDLKTQDMVKLHMEGKALTWTKDGSSVTTEPPKGNIIVNANVPIADTVVDRTLLNKVVMNKKMNLKFNEKFVEALSQEEDHYKLFIDHLRRIILDKTVPELTEKEIKYVLDFTQESIVDNEQEQGYSRRIIIRQLSYFQRAKKLFGSLDKEVLEFIQPLAESYIINERTPGLIESILGDSSIEKPKLIKTMSVQGGYTEQHARRLVNRDIESGKLVLTGKMISLGGKNVK